MRFKFAQLYSLFLVVLLYGTHYFDSAPVFFFLLIIGAVLLINRPILLAPVYFISSLSGTFFVIHGFGSASRYLSLILIISLLFTIIRRKQLSNKAVVNSRLIVIIIIFSFFSAAFSKSASLTPFLLMLQNLLILLLFSKYETSKFKTLYKLIYFSSLITLSLLILEILFSGIDLLNLERRFSINEEVNVNRLAMMVVQLGVILILPIFKGKGFKNNLSFLTVPIIIILIISTGSRTALLAYLIPIVITYMFIYSEFSLTKFIVLIICSLIIGQLWSYLEENISFMNRFSIENVAESGGGINRLESIKLLLENVIPNNVLLGVGLGGENTILALQSYGNDLKPSHNIIVDQITQIGLLGFSLYSLLMIKIFKPLIKFKKSSYILYMPILIIFSGVINGIGETIFLEKFFWNGFAIAVFFLNHIKDPLRHDI